jgi:hypothetical protein
MATQVQQRRGNTTQSDAFTGASGELTVNTSNNSVRVHDGSKLGGWELLRSDLTNLSVPLPAGQPAGNTTEVQFNDAGEFAASAAFTFDAASNLVTAANLAVTELVVSNLMPEGDLVLSLGNLTNRWANLFTGSLEATDANLSGNLIANGDITSYGNVAITGGLTVGGAVFEGDDSSVVGNFTVGDTITAANANLANATIGNLTVDTLIVANLAATQLVNGNSNVIVVPNAEVTISSNGVANIVTVNETGTRFEQTSNFAGNVVLNQGVSITNLANLKIPGGLPNQFIQTDGTGNLIWATGGGGGGIAGGFANGTTEGMIPVADGNINFSVAGTTNIMVITGLGANVLGNFDVGGTTTVVDLEASGNIEAFVINATSKINTVDLTANGNVDLGSVSNITISGGANGQVLQTDGAGNLFWTAIPSGQGFANGTSGGNIPVAGGNVNFTVGGIANTVVFAPTQTDINTKLNVNGDANIVGEILGAGNANIALNADIGSNLSVGGWANIVGNVVAGNVVTTGDVTGVNGIYSGNMTVTANLSANNGTFTNNVTAVNTTLTGTMKAATGNITGNLAVGGNTTIVGVMTSQTANVTGLMTAGNVETDVVTANVANIAGNVNAVNGNFTNNVSASNGVFSANVTAVNSTLSGNIKAAAGNITGNLAVGENANIVGSMNSATANVTGNAIIGNVSTDLMESNVANIAGNLTSGNANLGNLATANFFSGDGSLLTNVMAKGQFTMNYSYTDPNPLNLLIVPAGSTVTLATVVVVTPFNDVTATISMGDTANANSLLATTDISAQVNGTFTAQPALRYGADTQLILGITPGTSTQGDGVLVINYV